jgi:hypothetical protein
MSCLPSNRATLSPNRKRHIVRVVIWSAAAALLAELSYLAVDRLV